MGGDFIGSTLVYQSTGIDFVKAVIEIALGEKPELISEKEEEAAGVRFIFSQEDIDVLEELKKDESIKLIYEEVHPITQEVVSDSSTRFGCYVFTSANREQVMKYLPVNEE